MSYPHIFSALPKVGDSTTSLGSLATLSVKKFSLLTNINLWMIPKVSTSLWKPSGNIEHLNPWSHEKWDLLLIYQKLFSHWAWHLTTITCWSMIPHRPHSIEGARKSFRMGFQVLPIPPPALPDPGESWAVKHPSWSLWDAYQIWFISQYKSVYITV